MDLDHKTNKTKCKCRYLCHNLSRDIYTKLIGGNNKFDFTVPVLDVARDHKKSSGMLNINKHKTKAVNFRSDTQNIYILKKI